MLRRWIERYAMEYKAYDIRNPGSTVGKGHVELGKVGSGRGREGARAEHVNVGR